MRSLITVLAIGLVAAILGGPPAASQEQSDDRPAASFGHLDGGEAQVAFDGK